MLHEAEQDGSFLGSVPYIVLVAVWGGGVLLGLLWLALCQLSLRRIRRGCVPITAGDAPEILRALCAKRMRSPQLLVGARVPSPFLTGLWRPAILLPASYRADFDSPALRAILAHELAHIARRDCVWNLLARLVCMVGWVQPLLWILCRRLEQARRNQQRPDDD